MKPGGLECIFDLSNARDQRKAENFSKKDPKKVCCENLTEKKLKPNIALLFLQNFVFCQFF